MNLTDFHFLRPLWLLAALPTAALLISLIRRQQAQGLWSSVCDSALLPYIIDQKPSTQRRWPLWLASLASMLTIVALAGPTWQRLPTPAFRNDAALVIALNLSTSMNAADVKPSRLIRARYKISDLLKQRKDGQTALLVYSGAAFTVTPLTNDRETIENQLSALTTDIMPSEGNDTALALQKAGALLQQAGLQNGQILLVTDAVDTAKTLGAVKKLSNYTISILAVGTENGAPIQAPQGDFVKDANGSIIIPKLNLDSLTQVVKTGHGQLVQLSDDNADTESLTRFFEHAVQEQGATNDNLLLQQWVDQGPWLVLLVLPLAALFFRKGLLGLALLIFLPIPKNSYAFEWRDLWQTKDQQAQQAFQQQDYKTAAEQFQNPEWQAAANYKTGNYQQALDNLKDIHSADSFYNQGNALAKNGQLPEALKAYEQALKLKPDDADTKFNKALVEKELEKQKQQQDQQKQQDSKNQQDSKDQKDQQSKQNKDQNQQDQQNKSSDQDQDQDQDQEDKSQNSQDQADQKPDQNKENAEQTEQKPEDKQKEAQAAKPEAQKSPEDAKKPEQQSQVPSDEQPKDETTQANEQWLKRIPDDPSGLLRRKFKYQYGQGQRQQ